MQCHAVTSILSRWPDRRAILDDARAEEPTLELVAVHRWMQRQTIPPRYWAALLDGAARRGLTVTADELARAHAKDAA